MKSKILIMGLPGSGKTTLATKLFPLLNAKWLNADSIRKSDQNFDYSEMGRIRQAKRMSDIADAWIEEGHHVVADFICPTLETRKIFKADYTIWMNTIEKSDYNDTNEMFVKPIVANGDDADIVITEKDADKWANIIYSILATLGNVNV
tara:strand:- start:884 stop:1330 length:447 start_codon:yes stop_codon:yes gene_type:complete